MFRIVIFCCFFSLFGCSDFKNAEHEIYSLNKLLPLDDFFEEYDYRIKFFQIPKYIENTTNKTCLIIKINCGDSCYLNWMQSLEKCGEDETSWLYHRMQETTFFELASVGWWSDIYSEKPDYTYFYNDSTDEFSRCLNTFAFEDSLYRISTKVLNNQLYIITERLS